ncbi:molybdenum cofactor biosynthesis enzyme [Adlercreutzia sp. R21]|uniref:molybdenum cofactor biosynthesis enzyme n=1 Tax=Adlercreutzia wanghongyangiae TaxID=3111451 RepID=UPI002DBBA1C4|nr:molybdenum cofactor biosynthesis enzyme [Adlercreutzia sp. R21]MEC4184666.1 molybdenum cofactor biosynthesis enzyme [Adlercreutzia sp. R21]
MRGIERMMRDEDGFTTAGMAVALLVSLSLLFSAAQVYRINALAADVQDVADAAALAAESQVGEFMVAVRATDGAVLSMTLLGIASYGLGVVGLCVPPTAELGAQLISAGQKVLQARDNFAESAAATLDRLQQALPFLAAANAAAVAQANGEGRAGAMAAMAVLLPGQGEPIAVGASSAETELAEAVESEQDELAEAAAKAEGAAQAADEAKERGFRRDCGDQPSYCMYERAAHLASLAGADNPLYASADTWTFSVALNRARAYYAQRLLRERPESDSVEEKARSALRRNFYRYAVRELREACAVPPDASGAVTFPVLPRNIDQMRGTSLYTDPAYPVDAEGDVPVMHAWEGCPGLGLTDSYASVQTLEAGGFAECPSCHFTPSSLGNVAAASTSIENGFEYHYAAVAQAAQDYRRAVQEAEPLNRLVKEKAQGLLDKMAAALEEVGSFRIQARPPGSDGCIALVVATGAPADDPFESAFVQSSRALGTRAAIGAATLVADETEGASVIGDVLDGLNADGSAAVGAARMVLDCWSGLLQAYATGQEALVGAVEEALGTLPLAGAAGLGPWAADALRTTLGAAGLQPAETAPLKPVLAGSADVAAADGGSWSVRYLTLREDALAATLTTTEPFAALADRIEREAFDQLAGMEVQIAVIELPGGLSVPLTLTLPPPIEEAARGLVERACDAVRSASGWFGGERPWE